MIFRCWFLIIFSFCNQAYPQQNNPLAFKNGIENPSILATHHFGIFSSRINQNFKLHNAKNVEITLSSASGNNFHPFVEAYLPKDPIVREQLSKLKWHDRPFNFRSQEETPADYMNVVIDAVIKEFRLGINLPINKQHELGINLRTYLITKGKYPFSLFTSDESIEWFHSNIFGGEDPYGRRYYGLNQVNFKYTDRNGTVLELNNRDFFIGGIEINHFYYPQFLRNDESQLYFNIGNHLGINTSKFNNVIDIGLSLNAIKKISLKSKNELNVGVGASLLRKNIITIKNGNDLGNNNYLASLQGEVEFTKFTKKLNYHAFGINFHIQSRYNKLEETNYHVFKGKWKEINGGWQHGFSTTYDALSDWTFIYSYGCPNYTLILYFKEDLEVNNAPDFQTGIGLKIPFLHN